MSELSPNDPPPVPASAIPMVTARRHPTPTHAGPALPTYHAVSAYRQRPSLLTAVAVISIIIASLSCITGAIGGCEAMVISTTVKRSRVLFKSSLPPAANSGAQPIQHIDIAADNRKRDGLPFADRRLVVSVLAELQPMNLARTAQLNYFLSENGQVAFPTGGAHLTALQIRNSVSLSNTIAGDSDGVIGVTIFITSWGTLKVRDAGVDFTPADGSSPISMAALTDPNDPLPKEEDPEPESPTTHPVAAADPGSGDAAPDNITPTIAGTAGPVTRLTAGEVRSILKKTQTAGGNRFTPSQLNSLQTVLEDPAQTYIAPGTAWSPIRQVYMNSDGSAFIAFSGGFLEMSAAGSITPFNGLDPYKKSTQINTTLVGLAALDAVVTIGLAIFLFLAGLSVLRQAPSGRWMHLLYAGLKIPLVLLGGFAVSEVTNQFVSAFHGSASWGTYAILLSVLGAIYPVVLLILMNLKTVKAYYAPVGG